MSRDDRQAWSRSKVMSSEEGTEMSKKPADFETGFESETSPRAHPFKRPDAVDEAFSKALEDAPGKPLVGLQAAIALVRALEDRACNGGSILLGDLRTLRAQLEKLEG